MIYFLVLLFPFFVSADTLDALVDDILKIEAVKPIVSIAGCPGVGKSTLAKNLQKRLSDRGVRSAIISLDEFGKSQEDRKVLTSELDPRRIYWDQIHLALTKVKMGGKLKLPSINQLTKERGEKILDLDEVDVILFEGSYALGHFSPIDFLQYADYAIYIETDLENIYDWKWEREFKKTISRTSKAFFFHMKEIMQDFAFHVYPTRKNANKVLHIDAKHNFSLEDSEYFREIPTPDFKETREELLVY